MFKFLSVIYYVNSLLSKNAYASVAASCPTPEEYQNGCPDFGADVCYNWNCPTSLGCYVDCSLGNIVNVAQLILVGVAIIMAIFLIYKTVKAIGSADSQQLQEIPQRWIYLFLLALIVIGAGGTMLNIIMNFLGFGPVSTWLNTFNDLLIKIR